jgi:hypothetical protein
MKPTKKRRKRTRWTPKAEGKFLGGLALMGVVSYAAQEADMSRSACYARRKMSRKFREAWDEALEVASDGMELAARQRAVSGVPEPQFYRGQEIGAVTRYSDQLLMFLLRAWRPEKYRERSEISMPGIERAAQTLGEAMVEARRRVAAMRGQGEGAPPDRGTRTTD